MGLSDCIGSDASSKAQGLSAFPRVDIHRPVKTTGQPVFQPTDTKIGESRGTTKTETIAPCTGLVSTAALISGGRGKRQARAVRPSVAMGWT